jgi:hypothetical protein
LAPFLAVLAYVTPQFFCLLVIVKSVRKISFEFFKEKFRCVERGVEVLDFVSIEINQFVVFFEENDQVADSVDDRFQNLSFFADDFVLNFEEVSSFFESLHAYQFELQFSQVNSFEVKLIQFQRNFQFLSFLQEVKN